MLNFFLTAKEEYYFCGLEEGFGEYNNAIQLENNKSKKVDLLDSHSQEKAYLVRKLVQGVNFDIIDLIFIGSEIKKLLLIINRKNTNYLKNQPVIGALLL